MLELIKAHKISYVIGLSVSSALAFSVHPNGILILMNAGIFMLIEYLGKKDIRSILIFGFFALIICIIPFSIMLMDDIKYQDIIAQAGSRNYFGATDTNIFKNLSNFVNSYILGIKRLYILAFELGVLFYVLVYHFNKKSLRYLAGFGIINFIVSIIIFTPYFSRFFSQVLIFSSICIAFVFQETPKQSLRFKVLLTLSILYFMNNFAGDLYILLKNRKNLSHTEISKQINLAIGTYEPKDIEVFSNIEFWYFIKDTKFYGAHCYYPNKEYENRKEQLEKGQFDYIIISKFDIAGKTATSGRPDKIYKYEIEFHQDMDRIKLKHAELMKTIKTPENQYGDIEIWKVNL
jgi:hypothetical protein